MSISKIIREYPTFENKQQGDTDCGPTSMSYALAMCGIEVDPQRLPNMVDRLLMSQIGTLPTWFSKVALKYGLSSEDILERSFRDYASIVKDRVKHGFPVIMLVEGGHWVTIVGFEKDKFIINDPACEAPILNQWSRETFRRKSEFDFEALGMFNNHYAFSCGEW